MLRKDLKLFFTDKKSWIIIVIALAVAAAAALAGGKAAGGAAVRIGVCDEDNSEYSRLLTGFFSENRDFSSYVSIERGGRRGLERELEEGRLDMVLVIPEGFAGSLIHMENKSITALISSADTTKAVLLKNLLEAYAQYITSVELNCETLYDVMEAEKLDKALTDAKNVEISYELLFTALGKDSFFDVSGLERMKGVTVTDYYIYTACFLLTAYAGMYAGLGLYREKSRGILSRLRTTGRSMAGLLAQKLCFFLIMFGITAVLPALFAGGSQGAALRLAVCLAALLVSLTLFMFAAGMFKSCRQYVIAGGTAILFVLICGGGIIPAAYLPPALSAAARALPLYTFVRHMALAQSLDPAQTLIYCGACVILAAALFAAAAFRLERSSRALCVSEG